MEINGTGGNRNGLESKEERYSEPEKNTGLLISCKRRKNYIIIII